MDKEVQVLELLGDKRFLLFYKKLMEKRISSPAEIGEKHHVLPRCMGGIDGTIVKLTYREHFIAHALLARAFPDNQKLNFAYWGMCNQSNAYQNRKRPKSILYEAAKSKRGEHMSNLLKGRKFSDETIKKMSASAKNRKNQSPMCIKGHKKSDEHRKNASISAKNRQKRQCPHCKKEIQPHNYAKYHGDKCKVINPTLTTEIYTRKCPCCQIEIVYKRKNSMRCAERKQRFCKFCAHA